MKGIKNVITLLGLIVFIVVVTLCLIIVFKSYSEPDKIPSLWGWKPLIVLSSPIETNIMDGDLIFVKEVDVSELKVGDVILFRTYQNVVLTHKITDIINDEGETKYYIKGENSTLQNDNLILKNQIEGIYRYRIPNLGKILYNFQKPIVMLICILIPLVILILAQFCDIKKHQKLQKALEDETNALKQQNKELMKK